MLCHSEDACLIVSGQTAKGATEAETKGVTLQRWGAIFQDTEHASNERNRRGAQAPPCAQIFMKELLCHRCLELY
jgi:hypothetical protein